MKTEDLKKIMIALELAVDNHDLNQPECLQWKSVDQNRSAMNIWQSEKEIFLDAIECLKNECMKTEDLKTALKLAVDMSIWDREKKILRDAIERL